MLALIARGLTLALLSCALLATPLIGVTTAEAQQAEVVRARGAWSATVNYVTDDLVTLRGSAWRAKRASKGKVPGSTTPPTTADDWELFAAGLNPRGPWTDAPLYHRNDLVLHLNATWRALRTNAGKTPGQSASDWQLFAQKGATGATGATGPIGPQGPAGPSAVGNGTQTAPSFNFTSSTSTGIFSPSTAKIALVEGGSLFLHNIGTENTALGLNALDSNTAGADNTAIGRNALTSNINTSFNTAVGSFALTENIAPLNTAVGHQVLRWNTTGVYNTAVGASALFFNETGSANTAVGTSSLYENIGNNNTGLGFEALKNSTGHSNTAVGSQALVSNTTASDNTAVGRNALKSNQTGISNVAVGNLALENSTANNNTGVGHSALRNTNAGADNTALGVSALFTNTTGNNNTALGRSALFSNTTGSNNIAIGEGAGFFATTTITPPVTPNNNIFIGNQGLAGDTTTIKIGTQGTQTSTAIAGIWGAATGGDAVAVVIDSTGKLGTTVSSRRYKEDIHAMGAMSAMLAELRPVTFRYIKPLADGSKPIQYGLIAEEVAEVFPYLAVLNDKGQPDTVKYHLLPTFLLEGFQEQQKIIAAQAEQLARQQANIEALMQQNAWQQASLEAQAERTAALEERLLGIEAQLTRPSITAASDSR